MERCKLQDKILKQNKEAWDAIADDWFGTTALPIYGVFIPTETELSLFGDVKGKRLLDIGCGSGHSLKYHGDNGASELWGIDISTKQIENANRFLQESGYTPKLFNSPMEINPGIPADYFDIVYSIYALGWTVDIERTFRLISAYLKKDGVLIFSWDHPFLSCVDTEDDRLIFNGNYFETEPFTFQKDGNDLFAYNRKFSDYINPLARAGFAVEVLVEETDKAALEGGGEFRSNYYSPVKAKRFPLSFIIKARKL